VAHLEDQYGGDPCAGYEGYQDPNAGYAAPQVYYTMAWHGTDHEVGFLLILCNGLMHVTSISTKDDNLPSARRHGVFGYPKQNATVSVYIYIGSVLK
jgi:hypothetical protein